MLGVGCGMHGAGCVVQGAGCGMWCAGCRVVGAGCGMQAAGCGVREEGCRVMRTRCWVRDVGCGMRGAGFWVLGAGCGVLGAGCWVRGRCLGRISSIKISWELQHPPAVGRAGRGLREEGFAWPPLSQGSSLRSSSTKELRGGRQRAEPGSVRSPAVPARPGGPVPAQPSPARPWKAGKAALIPLCDVPGGIVAPGPALVGSGGARGAPGVAPASGIAAGPGGLTSLLCPQHILTPWLEIRSHTKLHAMAGATTLSRGVSGWGQPGPLPRRWGQEQHLQCPIPRAGPTGRCPVGIVT